MAAAAAGLATLAIAAARPRRLLAGVAATAEE
jgi:hypothetical protein